VVKLPGGNIIMKTTIVVLTILFLSASCQKKSPISLKNSNQNRIIALQPLGAYNEQQLAFVRDELSSFFNIRVLLLSPVDIPQPFFNRIEEKYFGDSLIRLLSKFGNDTIVEVVGVTHKDIYTKPDDKIQANNNSSVSPAAKGIFGLGYVSGNSCIISDYRLMSNDKELLKTRLRKAIIHEIGHNLGLTHCPADTCLMSETNGYIATLSKIGGDYCLKCRRKLN